VPCLVVQIGNPSETDPGASRYLNERRRGRCLCESRKRSEYAPVRSFGWDGMDLSENGIRVLRRNGEEWAAFISEKGSLSSRGLSARSAITAGGRTPF